MKTTAIRLSTLMLLGMFAVGLLSGCAWSIGDSGKPACAAHVQATKGQELIDLKKAKDQGALTDQEYEAQKQKIMER